MSDDEMRVAVAELCGIKQIWSYALPERCIRYDVPDYPNSLDAMHEAEKTLTDEEHKRFRGLLFSMNYNEGTTSEDAERGKVSATARQRAVAFLRAKGVEVGEKI